MTRCPICDQAHDQTTWRNWCIDCQYELDRLDKSGVDIAEWAAARAVLVETDGGR